MLEQQVWLDLCTTDERPLVLDGAFRYLLTAHFSSASNIVNSRLSGLIYSDDPATTRIRIETIHKWSPRLVDKHPAIIIRRGPWAHIELSINSNEWPVGEVDGQIVRRCNHCWKGEHGFLCMSRVPAEADELAFEVADFLATNQRNIVRALRLYQFEVSDIGALTKLANEAEDIFAAGVRVDYVLVESRWLTSASSSGRTFNVAFQFGGTS